MNFICFWLKRVQNTIDLFLSTYSHIFYLFHLQYLLRMWLEWSVCIHIIHHLRAMHVYRRNNCQSSQKPSFCYHFTDISKYGEVKGMHFSREFRCEMSESWEWVKKQSTKEYCCMEVLTPHIWTYVLHILFLFFCQQLVFGVVFTSRYHWYMKYFTKILLLSLFLAPPSSIQRLSLY